MVIDTRRLIFARVQLFVDFIARKTWSTRLTKKEEKKPTEIQKTKIAAY